MRRPLPAGGHVARRFANLYRRGGTVSVLQLLSEQTHGREITDGRSPSLHRTGRELWVNSPQRFLCDSRVHAAALPNLLLLSEPRFSFLQKRSLDGPRGSLRSVTDYAGQAWTSHTTPLNLLYGEVGEGPFRSLSKPGGSGPSPGSPRAPPPTSGPRAPRGYLAIVPAERQVAGRRATNAQGRRSLVALAG